MSEPTLNSIKTAITAEADAKSEALRLETKTARLTHLVSVEERLTKFVDAITDRRATLKVQKDTAKSYLKLIADNADNEEFEVESIEALLNSIDHTLGANSPAAYANGGPVGAAKPVEAIIVNVAGALNDEDVARIREVVKSINRPSRRAA